LRVKLHTNECVFGRGSVPDPASGAYSAASDSLARLRGGERGRNGGKGRRGREGERRDRKGEGSEE